MFALVLLTTLCVDPGPNASRLAVIRTMPDFTLTTQADEPLRREDLRQNVAVTARTGPGRDLGSAIRDIKAKLDQEMTDRTGFTLEFGGLYQQQQESFRNLTLVLVAAVLLVFLVLLIEFRSLLAPLAIVWGSLLSLAGVGLKPRAPPGCNGIKFTNAPHSRASCAS